MLLYGILHLCGNFQSRAEIYSSSGLLCKYCAKPKKQRWEETHVQGSKGDTSFESAQMQPLCLFSSLSWLFIKTLWVEAFMLGPKSVTVEFLSVRKLTALGFELSPSETHWDGKARNGFQGLNCLLDFLKKERTPSRRILQHLKCYWCNCSAANCGGPGIMSNSHTCAHKKKTAQLCRLGLQEA